MSDSMADKLRRNLSAKNVTAIVLFGAIILVFVFFGLPDRLGQGIGAVAQVNNTLISFADFQQEENRILQYYQSMFGSQIDFSSRRQDLKRQALDNLVEMELISQGAKKEGILATDAEVRDFIVKDIAAFQENGVFQRERYFAYLENTRSTPSQFESGVRRSILNIRARHLFETALTINEVEAAKLRSIQRQKINVQFAKIDGATVEKELKREKAEELYKSLEDALEKGDEAAVNSVLKNLKVKWEETGLVDLAAETFPNIPSEIATEAIFDLKKSEPLYRKLVRDGSMKFVLKLKEQKVAEDKPLETTASRLSAKQRSVSAFESWVRHFEAKSEVKKQDAVLKM